MIIGQCAARTKALLPLSMTVRSFSKYGRNRSQVSGASIGNSIGRNWTWRALAARTGPTLRSSQDCHPVQRQRAPAMPQFCNLRYAESAGPPRAPPQAPVASRGAASSRPRTASRATATAPLAQRDQSAFAEQQREQPNPTETPAPPPSDNFPPNAHAPPKQRHPTGDTPILRVKRTMNAHVTKSGRSAIRGTIPMADGITSQLLAAWPRMILLLLQTDIQWVGTRSGARRNPGPAARQTGRPMRGPGPSSELRTVE